MAEQFMRKQAYGFRTSSKKKWTIVDITRENLRKEANCSHVAAPMPPRVAIETDKGPMTTAGVCRYLRGQVKLVEKDTGKKVRSDAQIYLNVVFSYHVPMEKIAADTTWELWRGLDEWEQRLERHIQKRYGDQVYGALVHYEESRIHWHLWVVAKRVGNKLTLDKAHPGLLSETLVKDPLLRKPAYKEAMSCDQFIYWLDVNRPIGINHRAKFPQPRLSHKMAGVKKKKDEEAAELAARKERERKWREEEGAPAPRPRGLRM